MWRAQPCSGGGIHPHLYVGLLRDELVSAKGRPQLVPLLLSHLWGGHMYQCRGQRVFEATFKHVSGHLCWVVVSTLSCMACLACSQLGGMLAVSQRTMPKCMHAPFKLFDTAPPRQCAPPPLPLSSVKPTSDAIIKPRGLCRPSGPLCHP
jgi:hypothetical protein